MKYKGILYLGADLLNILENSSNNSSPNKDKQDSKEKPSEAPVNNIIINNFNGNVLKNITNIENNQSKPASNQK